MFEVFFSFFCTTPSREYQEYSTPDNVAMFKDLSASTQWRWCTYTQRFQACVRFTYWEFIHSADLFQVLSSGTVKSDASYGGPLGKSILSTSASCAFGSLTTPLHFGGVINLWNLMAWGHLILLFTAGTSSRHCVPWRSGGKRCRATSVMNGWSDGVIKPDMCCNKSKLTEIPGWFWKALYSLECPNLSSKT